MKNTQIKYRQWMGTEWRYWGFIDGGFVAPIQGIEDSYQLLPLTDKDGDEIWEGDILQNQWDNSTHSVVFKNGYFNCGQGGNDKYKIIGNIKENPELLEELNESK